MLTIQLKVEGETANPIKAMKRIDSGLRVDTLARAAPPFSRGGRRRARGRRARWRSVELKEQRLLGPMSPT